MSCHISQMTISRLTESVNQEFKDLFNRSIRSKIHNGDRVFEDLQKEKIRCRLFIHSGKIQAAAGWRREEIEITSTDGTKTRAWEILFLYPDSAPLITDLFGYIAKSCQRAAKDALSSSAEGAPKDVALCYPLKNPNPELAGALLSNQFKVAQRGPAPDAPTIFLLKNTAGVVQTFEERSKKPASVPTPTPQENAAEKSTREPPRQPVPILPPRQPVPILPPGSRSSESRAGAASVAESRNKVVKPQFGIYSPQGRYKSVTLMGKYVELIASGKKTVEGRINTGMFQNVISGAKFRFYDRRDERNEVFCTVRAVEIFKSFKDMLSCYGTEACVPGERSLESAVILYERIPGYKDKAARHGVVGIELQVDRKDTSTRREEKGEQSQQDRSGRGESSSHKRGNEEGFATSRKKT